MLKTAANYIKDWYVLPSRRSKQHAYPLNINFPITDNCNSQCVMCDVWKEKSEDELTSDEIRDIFSNKLFKKVRHLGISGGEPTLRNDLLDCVRSILDTLETLESLSITSHGYHHDKWKTLLPAISVLCQEKSVRFTLNLSLDGVGEVHDLVRGIPKATLKLSKTIKIARELGINLEFQSTISSHNVFNINALLYDSTDDKKSLTFRQAVRIARLDNKESVAEVALNEHEKSFFSDFLKSEDLNKNTKNPARRLFYKDLSTRLIQNTERKAPCYFQNEGLVLDAHGNLYHCSIDEELIGNVRKEDPYKLYFSDRSRQLRNRLLSEECPVCYHDQSGSWNPKELILESLANTKYLGKFKKYREYIKFLFNNLLNFGKLLKPRIRFEIDSERLESAVIIGAYGGEHVGDSAILGGVILRISKKYNISNFRVLSTRPDRTEVWVKGLDIDGVTIVVDDYHNAKQILNPNMLMVWAGGPIMEIPRTLFDHYKLIIHSKYKLNMPFVIEGCGWGPFKTSYSKLIARKILGQSDFTTLRQNPNLEKFSYEVSKDPAFEYLDFLSSKDETSNRPAIIGIEKFFEKLDKNKEIVALNIRPTWSKYVNKGYDAEKIERDFMKETVELIQDNPHVNFLFIPFNTDHYGFSDMKMAYQIRRLSKYSSNYFIYERELTAGPMFYLLKKINKGVFMRFHACIFGMSAEMSVFGIDYTMGELGKVGDLMIANNKSDAYASIMNFKKEHVTKVLNI